MTKAQVLISEVFSRDSKSAIFAAGLHVMIFFALFSFSNPSVDISNFQSAGSFSVFSESVSNEGISLAKTKVAKNDSNRQTNQQSESPKNSSSENSSEVIFNAKNLGNPNPEYPLLAKRRGEEGTVLVRAFVGEDGLASKVEIAQSSSFSLLDNAAVEAIKKWRFVPAKRLGQVISSSVIIPITFKLT